MSPLELQKYAYDHFEFSLLACVDLAEFEELDAVVRLTVEHLNQVIDIARRKLELKIVRQNLLEVTSRNDTTVLLVEYFEQFARLIKAAVLLVPLVSNEHLECIKFHALALGNFCVDLLQFVLCLPLILVPEAKVLQNALEVRHGDVAEVLLVIVLEGIDKISLNVARQDILLSKLRIIEFR